MISCIIYIIIVCLDYSNRIDLKLIKMFFYMVGLFLLNTQKEDLIIFLLESGEKLWKM